MSRNSTEIPTFKPVSLAITVHQNGGLINGFASNNSMIAGISIMAFFMIFGLLLICLHNCDFDKVVDAGIANIIVYRRDRRLTMTNPSQIISISAVQDLESGADSVPYDDNALPIEDIYAEHPSCSSTISGKCVATKLKFKRNQRAAVIIATRDRSIIASGRTMSEVDMCILPPVDAISIPRNSERGQPTVPLILPRPIIKSTEINDTPVARAEIFQPRRISTRL